jgi:hypothetical protein
MMTTQGMPQQRPQHPMSGHMGQQGLPGDTRRMYGPNQYTTGPQQMQAQQQYPGQQHPNQYTHPHQQPGQQQYSQQQYQQQQQANQQMMGRSGMRQQVPVGGPIGQMGHQMQHQGMQAQGMQANQQAYNAMYSAGGLPGNKQRPTSLDLHSATSPRPSSQPNYNNLQQGQSQQQQQHSGMLGSLFASGKKILEEATTPLGARGPFAHPNQSHTAMGHHPVQGPQGPPPQSYGQYQTGVQQHQLMYGQSGPGQQMGHPMMGQQMGGQPQGGTILNTMKNIFKL